MIFVTVGHQTPFDRLIEAIDLWAAAHPDVEIFAQIGEGSYEPRHVRYERWLSAERFEAVIGSASRIVSHAGIGTIMMALMADTPLLALPRRAAYGETRNDHQLGTARYFRERNLILVVDDEADLPAAIEQLADWQPEGQIREAASPELLERLRAFTDA